MPFCPSFYWIYPTTSQYLSSYGCAITIIYTWLYNQAYGYFRCDSFMTSSLDSIAPCMVCALSPLGRDNLSCALYTEGLHPIKVCLSLSTGAALVSPTRSSSQDSSHSYHLAEGRCTCHGSSEMGTGSAWAYNEVIPQCRGMQILTY